MANIPMQGHTTYIYLTLTQSTPNKRIRPTPHRNQECFMYTHRGQTGPETVAGSSQHNLHTDLLPAFHKVMGSEETAT